MPPKLPIPAAPKGGPGVPAQGAELDKKTALAFPSLGGGYADIAHSSTPQARDQRQFLREAHKKGVTPEVLKAIGLSSSAPPSPAQAPQRPAGGACWSMGRGAGTAAASE